MSDLLGSFSLLQQKEDNKGKICWMLLFLMKLNVASKPPKF